jgi:hypothetical protein
MNGSTMPYVAPMGHRQSWLHNNYESRPGYAAMPPPSSATSPQFVPTAQYGFNQQYSPPVMYTHHHQSNSFARNAYRNPRSHSYERNSHHVNGGKCNNATKR